ncbi:hypothetical protein AVEN_272932-1 [Araneus ventricosus]|uniref:Uncharacterized protein n=1 Tax=Araneus ventricosus TaxID=182803 RepID=A0A4Y2PYM6_ARAVE|nr:hypothetical protein AVEN_272932-1 [Araneus ventricosus]
MPFQYLAPRRLLQSIIKHSNLRRWREEWDNGLTGGNFNQILPNVCLYTSSLEQTRYNLRHWPLTSYFKRFHIKESDCCCREVGVRLHYATSFPFAASFHLTKLYHYLEAVWRNKVMKNKLSMIKTRNQSLNNFPFLFPSSTHLP